MILISWAQYLRKNKTVTGLDATKFGYTATHTLSSGTNQARDANKQSRQDNSGCVILDFDFEAGFDWLDILYGEVFDCFPRHFKFI